MNIIIMLTYSACNTFGLQIVYSVETNTNNTPISRHHHYKKTTKQSPKRLFECMYYNM